MYSTEEIQQAVQKLVLSTIRRPFDVLGTRRWDVTFTQIQEAAAGVFLLHRGAPFYVAGLGAGRLIDMVEQERSLLDQIEQAVDALSRRSVPVRDLSPLANARAALFELEGAIGQRSTAFRRIEEVPAYRRFYQNLTQFMDGPGQNVRAGTSVVQTAEQARKILPPLVQQLEALHREMIRKAGLLAHALDDYQQVNLPALAALGVIARARQVLDQRFQQMSGQDDTQRLEVLREVVLELLTSRATVRQYGSFQVPGQFLDVQGLGLPYSDDVHPATGARLEGLFSAPFATGPNRHRADVWVEVLPVVRTPMFGQVEQVVVGGQLLPYRGRLVVAAVTCQVGDILYLDDGPNSDIRLVVTAINGLEVEVLGDRPIVPDAVDRLMTGTSASSEYLQVAGGYSAALDSMVRENYLVEPGGCTLSFGFDGGLVPVRIDVPVPAGSYSAQQLVDLINLELVAAGIDDDVVARTFNTPLKYRGVVDVVVVGPTATWTLQAGDLSVLNLLVGDLVEVLSGPDAGEVHQLTGIGMNYFETSSVGVAPDSGRVVEVGPEGRKVRITATDDYPAILNQWTFQAFGDTEQAATGCMLMGWPADGRFRSRGLTAREMIQDWNAKAQKSQLELIQDVASPTTVVRSLVENARAVSLSFVYRAAVCTITGGTQLTTTLSATDAAAVSVGDVLVIRSGTAANLSTQWEIIDVAGQQVTATGAGTDETGEKNIEIGPNLSVAAGQWVIIETGPSAGEYQVEGSRPVPFEVLLAGYLPVTRGNGGTPLFWTGQLVQHRVGFRSLDQTTNSMISVDGSGAQQLAPLLEVARATTPYIQLESIPRELELGDWVDIYTTDYTTPATSYEILAIDRQLRVLTLNGQLSATQVLSFDDGPPPFARLRSSKVYDYSSFRAALTLWLAYSSQQTIYWRDLARLINPLVANLQPSSLQLAEALQKLRELGGRLDATGATIANQDQALTLEAALHAYRIDPLPEVDDLLRTFIEKGSDRAIDILLEGQFQAFFGLTADGASYTGNMQEKMRELVREDLPVRKDNRPDANQSQHIATVEDEDFEYSQGDITDQQIHTPEETLDNE